jgi:hypothetical protein
MGETRPTEVKSLRDCRHSIDPSGRPRKPAMDSDTRGE